MNRWRRMLPARILLNCCTDMICKTWGPNLPFYWNCLSGVVWVCYLSRNVKFVGFGDDILQPANDKKGHEVVIISTKRGPPGGMILALDSPMNTRSLPSCKLTISLTPIAAAAMERSILELHGGWLPHSYEFFPVIMNQWHIPQ